MCSIWDFLTLTEVVTLRRRCNELTEVEPSDWRLNPIWLHSWWGHWLPLEIGLARPIQSVRCFRERELLDTASPSVGRLLLLLMIVRSLLNLLIDNYHFGLLTHIAVISIHACNWVGPLVRTLTLRELSLVLVILMRVFLTLMLFRHTFYNSIIIKKLIRYIS